SFPIIDSGNVRIPLGTPTAKQGETTTLRLGRVAIAIRRTKLPHVPVPKRRPDWRPPAYLLGALIVELFIYFLAISCEPFQRLVVKREPRLRYAHVGEPPPEPELQRVPSVAHHAAGDRAASSKTRESHEQTTVAAAVARAGKIDAVWRLAE